MVQDIRQRDVRLDALKAIGILSIILARCCPPPLVACLRLFDLPMMVIVSGMLFRRSVRDADLAIWPYLKRRALRLVPPTWVFLGFYFLVTWAVFAATGGEYPFSAGTIASSFGLIHGIGYVWIIRVFLLVAIVAPLLLTLLRRLGDRWFLIALGAAYGLHVGLVWLTAGCRNPVARAVLDYVVLCVLPYGAMFGLGLWMADLSVRRVLPVGIAALLVFVAILLAGAAMTGGESPASATGRMFLSLPAYKYPPQTFLVSYSIAATCLLLLAVRTAEFGFVPLRRAVVFLSSSTLWIYLWHILFRSLKAWSCGSTPAFLKGVWTNYATIVALSVAAVLVQKAVVGALKRRLANRPGTVRVVSILFD